MNTKRKYLPGFIGLTISSAIVALATSYFSGIKSIRREDINGDGRDDLIVTNNLGRRKIYVATDDGRYIPSLMFQMRKEDEKPESLDSKVK